MYLHDIVFILNDDEKVVIDVENVLEIAPCCGQIPVFFCNNKQAYVLSVWAFPEDVVEYLKNSLIKVLNNELSSSVNYKRHWLFGEC